MSPWCRLLVVELMLSRQIQKTSLDRGSRPDRPRYHELCRLLHLDDLNSNRNHDLDISKLKSYFTRPSRVFYCQFSRQKNLNFLHLTEPTLQ